jgi:hypothetical protein
MEADFEFEFEFEILGNKERSDGSLATDREDAVRPFVLVRGTDGGHQDALESVLKLRTAREK